MTDPARFPFPPAGDVRPPDGYQDVLRTGAPHPVRLSSGQPALLVTRHQDVTAVLGDDRFSRAGYTELARPLFARRTESVLLATADAPDHTRRRRAILPAFTARQVRLLRPRLEALADRLLDELTAGAAAGEADLVGGFTVPFPMQVICEVLGVPVDDSTLLRAEVDILMSTSGHTREEVAAAQARMDDYFAALVADKRRAAEAGSPPEDLLTALATRPDGHPDRRLSDREVVALGSGMLMAGYETTGNSFGMCVLLLLRHSALAETLREQPGRTPAVIEEMLRFTSLNNTGGAPHLVTEDTVLGGCPVSAGQIVVPLTDAANRDLAVFADPDAFDPDRPDVASHLAFGYGRHLCLGAELARAELQIGVNALLRRFDVLELAVPEEELEWRRTMFINGVWRLPVRWSAARAAGPAAERPA
ncbi:cytochrome P450 [Kitasatospora aureofaciens]|uniref:cytochrome P450 n=1 Tax=Kitasatospora aureofaciens TaxID=1894 RepID=UPI00068D2AC9|nr:cytochrome P450 [Kitasatospora aureofaciens]HJD83567.1 cytochrome P450 [Kitasatospora aureofaciens]